MSVPLSPTTRPSAWEWTQTALLAASLAWTTLCLGGYRAETMVVTGALNLAMVVLHFGRRVFDATEAERPWHAAGWILLPFPVFAAANVLWVTPVRWLGWQDWLVWAQMVAVFWVVVNDLRARATRAVIFGLMVALAMVSVVLACYQRFADPAWLMLGATQTAQFLARSSGSFAVPNSLAAMLVLLLPATALAVWQRGRGAVARVGFGYVAAVLLLGLGLTLSRGAWLGLGLALIAWPLLVKGLDWRRRLRVFASVGVAVIGLVALVYASVPRARERLDFMMRDAGERSRPVMWRAAWRIFVEHPVFGSGAGSYAVLFEQHRPEHEQKDPQWAHNDYLNTLSDYGAVGFGLFFGGCGAVTWFCMRRRGGAGGINRRLLASRKRGDGAPAEHDEGASDGFETRAFTTALAVGLLAFALHLFVDFHLKIPALAMLAATVAGLCVSRAWPAGGNAETANRSAPPKWWRFAAGLAAMAAVGAGLGWIVPHYRAEAERAEARRRLDVLAETPSSSLAERRAITLAARGALSRAILLDAANPQAWADRAYTAAILGHGDPVRERELGLSAESDARRALAQTSAVPEFWLRLGVALDMQGRWGEAGEAFSEGLRLAPVNATTWFYYGYHLSLNRVTVPLARAAVATSLRLDPSRREAETLRQHLAARR